MDYKGENSCRIALTLELLNVIKKYAGKDKQTNGFWLMKFALLADKDFWVKELGSEEEYQNQVEHYSITNIEQRKKKELEKKVREIREEAKLKIEQLNAEHYAKQSDLAVENREKKAQWREARIKQLQDHIELLKGKQNDAHSENERVSLDRMIKADQIELEKLGVEK